MQGGHGRAPGAVAGDFVVGREGASQQVHLHSAALPAGFWFASKSSVLLYSVSHVWQHFWIPRCSSGAVLILPACLMSSAANDGMGNSGESTRAMMGG